MDHAITVFEAELEKRRIAFSPTQDEGVYEVHTHSGEIVVSLANIARDYDRDGDPGVVIHFVDQILRESEVPEWRDAQSRIYFSAEPSDHDFGETIREAVSRAVCRVLALTDLEEQKITWLTSGMLTGWSISQTEVEAAARDNMNRLFDGIRLEVQEIDGLRLGMVPVASVFKASTIFAPDFKAFVTAELDWPVLAVLPCRDFIYVLSETDKALLNRMGAVVQREYRQSAYPITTEVFRISDAGVEAIGAFPK